MDVEVKAVKNTVATPEGARRRLRGEERDRRFSLLRDRIQSGWGHSGPEAWDSRDAHLQQELLRLLHRGYDSLRKLKISMPVGVVRTVMNSALLQYWYALKSLLD